MKRSFSLLPLVVMAISLVVSAAHTAQAITYNFDVGPADLAAGKPQFVETHGTGDNNFAYDWDSARPQHGHIAPAGYGPTSFYANVAQSGATQPDRYRTFRLGLRDLFAADAQIDLSEIASISYQTDKNAPATAIDWRVTIYTVPRGPGMGDAGSFYRDRIQSFPQESASLNAPANQWNEWTTVPGSDNELVWFTNRAGFTTHNLTWAALTGNAVFTADEIMMIDFTLGANSGGGTGISHLDAIVINLVNGDVLDLNLVPEPASLTLASIGLLSCVGLAVRRRNSAKRTPRDT